MKKLQKIIKSPLIEYIIVVSILIIFEIAFMKRFDYTLPFGHVIISLASISLYPSIIVLFKSSKIRFVLYSILLFLSLILFVTNATLFYYKNDIFSLGMISDIGDGMNMGIKYNVFIAFKFIYWVFLFSWFIIAILILYRKLIKSKNVQSKISIKHSFILLFSLFVLFFPKIFINDANQTIYTSPQDKRTYLYTFGISSYNNKDMTSILGNLVTQKTRKVKAKEQLNDLNNIISEESPLFAQFENNNIIMIMTETVEEYAIDKILTPTLYELYYGKYSFLNTYGVGKSNYTYDAEFKSLTSMMYYNSDNLMHTYDENQYTNALPHVLRNLGYKTSYFHSFNGDFFNRNKLHPALGFEELYFEEDMTFSDVDMWSLDSELFIQMKDKIVPTQEQPFFSFITTLTSHGTHDEYRNELKEYYKKIEEDGRFNDYEIAFQTLLAAHMDLDKGLKVILDDVEDKGLEDETLFVIFSDHKNYSSQEITNKYSENIIYEEYDYDRVPFAIYHKNLNQKHFTFQTSHYDITPTILDLLGIKYNTNYYYGQSILLNLNGKYIDKPLIFGFNRWIHNQLIIYDNKIVYVDPNLSDVEIELLSNKIRAEVYATIDKYHAFFLTDYFRETALE